MINSRRIIFLLAWSVLQLAIDVPKSAANGKEEISFVQEVTAETSLNSPELVARQDSQIRVAFLLALVPIVVAFAFIVFIFYRKKREAYFKQTEAELKLNVALVEIKALRAQINPHFIFNCLNSIHHYMHCNDIKLAGDYLIKFSQLIRYVLETSSLRMVPLRDDLEALQLYLELERLRLQNSFEIKIDTSALADISSLHVPPMMMQPFAENSVWHGLNNKHSGGKIDVTLNCHEGMLICVIEDNGANGAVLAAEFPSIIKKTSFGMSLIRERLDVVSRIYGVRADFKLEDRKNDPVPAEGKRVVLSLPFEE